MLVGAGASMHAVLAATGAARARERVAILLAQVTERYWVASDSPRP